MKLLVAMMIGFGAGLVAAGIVAIVSPFREPVHNIGIVGLGTGLLLGGVMALVILQRQK